MKDLTITLSKAMLDNDIDQRTYKRMEASLQNLNETGRDAVASDTEEGPDAEIITRYRDYRDARIRKRLVRYLVTEVPSHFFTNRPKSPFPEYLYVFRVPDDFRTEIMEAIKDDLHEYIIRGTLYDWYKYAGIPPLDTEQSLEEMENDILNSLRGRPDVSARPLQPFGPPFLPAKLF